MNIDDPEDTPGFLLANLLVNNLFRNYRIYSQCLYPLGFGAFQLSYKF